MKEKFQNIFKKVPWGQSNDYDPETATLKNTSYDSSTSQISNISCLEKIKNYFIQSIQVETSYIKFFVLFLVGLGVTVLSFFYLPFVLLNPAKFSSLFSLGSFITISSFIFYYGTIKFFDLLFNKKRIINTILYIIGFLGTIFLPLIIGKNYISTLICSGMQLFCTIDFIFSFLPGGFSSLGMIWGLFMTPIKKIFSR